MLSSSSARSKSGVGDRAEAGEGEDFVTRLAARFFGRELMESEAPMGMQRIDKPEMYPATTEVEAAPVPGDSAELARLRPLLAGTQLEAVPLRMAFDAQRDGWAADSFHRCVDTFGAALVVAETAGGALMGGYNPRGWVGLGEEKNAIAAFLFTWPGGHREGYNLADVKLPKTGGGALAVTDLEGSGPLFGVESLCIPLEGEGEAAKAARSRLGSYFVRRPDGERTLFAAGEGNRAQLKSLRAYVVDGEPEKWELDGIIWKTSK